MAHEQQKPVGEVAASGIFDVVFNIGSLVLPYHIFVIKQNFGGGRHFRFKHISVSMLFKQIFNR